MPRHSRPRASLRRFPLRLLIALGLLICSLTGQAVERVALVSMGPGEEYWSRFGHNAIMIVDDGGDATFYNFGYFDFDQPGFFTRFLRGHMQYRLVALSAEQDLDQYRRSGRSVRVQWLNLRADEAESLAQDLAWQARPENSEYRYDYFYANCSTKVRDALDKALGGLIHKQIGGRSRGLSFRDEALRLGYPERWMYYGMHLGLGIAADQSMTRWHEAFVPERLAEAIALIKRDDGSPLVVGDEQWLPQLVESPPATPPRFPLSAVVLGLIWALGLTLLARRTGLAGILGRLLFALSVLAIGLAGWLMSGLWALTDHSSAWANRNLLLFSPLAPLLLAALPALAKDRPVAAAWRWLALLQLLAGAAAIGAYLLPIQAQDNLEWILLMLPVLFALHRLLARRPAADDQID